MNCMLTGIGLLRRMCCRLGVEYFVRSDVLGMQVSVLIVVDAGAITYFGTTSGDHHSAVKIHSYIVLPIIATTVFPPARKDAMATRVCLSF